MTNFTEVDPESFIDLEAGTPEFGRSCWVREGIGFDYRYMLSPKGQPRVGSQANKSLAHWAVSAGVQGIRLRLMELGHIDAPDKKYIGSFGTEMEAAVKKFQTTAKDPEDGRPLAVDGTVGRSDARALFTPVVEAAEEKYNIPDHLLLGETYHESRMDPGAIGFYIFYPDYRGVDRSISQINSKSNAVVSWEDAFNPMFAIDWSAKRLRKAFDDFKKRYPGQKTSVLWDAAVCYHNNPSAAGQWAKNGFPPTATAAKYVSDVKAARF